MNNLFNVHTIFQVSFATKKVNYFLLQILECGKHQCHQKCHGGSCGMCLELVTRKCKCGAYEKEVLCSKEFACTTRCGRLKSCGVHACNKKCCGGDCEPCGKGKLAVSRLINFHICILLCYKLTIMISRFTIECGKTLSCKNHKCQSECGHSGPCFPCPVSAVVKCRCGETMIRVPCGSERKAKPPSCQKM